MKNALESLGDMISQMTQSAEKKKEDEEKKKLAPRAVDEATVKALEQKAGKPGFDVNIRLVASALTQTRAEAILSGLESAFFQFDNQNFNGFSAQRVKGKRLQKL